LADDGLLNFSKLRMVSTVPTLKMYHYFIKLGQLLGKRVPYYIVAMLKQVISFKKQNNTIVFCEKPENTVSIIVIIW